MSGTDTFQAVFPFRQTTWIWFTSNISRVRTKAPGPMVKPLSQEAYSIYRHSISISIHGVFFHLRKGTVLYSVDRSSLTMVPVYHSIRCQSHKTTIVIFTSDNLKSHFALADASLRFSGRIPRNTSFQILPNILSFDVKLSDSLTASLKKNSSSKKKED